MNGENMLPPETIIIDLPIRDLLDQARLLFEVLLAADADSNAEGATDLQDAQARRLRQITIELRARAARLGPPVICRCACGATFTVLEDLDDHLLEVFIPITELAPDGTRHAEI